MKIQSKCMLWLFFLRKVSGYLIFCVEIDPFQLPRMSKFVWEARHDTVNFRVNGQSWGACRAGWTTFRLARDEQDGLVWNLRWKVSWRDLFLKNRRRQSCMPERGHDIENALLFKVLYSFSWQSFIHVFFL